LTPFHFQSDAMNIEQRLDQLAESCRARGYTVVIKPSPSDLPEFAKDFHVEIIAMRADGNVLAAVKKNQFDLEADRELPRYADVVARQSGWRLDLHVLGPEDQPVSDIREARELTEQDIRQAIDSVERMLGAGFEQPALIAAWAVLEAAMRRRLQAEGEEAGWGSSPRTMLNELYSAGVLESRDFRNLEDLYHARNAIVHGFCPPVLERSAVTFLLEKTRRLLDESRAEAGVA
jgi:REase_AHJR-like